MKTLKTTLIVAMALLMMVSIVSAEPTIGIYFDFDNTELIDHAKLDVSETGMGYIVTNADMVIAGAAFKLTDPGNLTIVREIYREWDVVIGDLFNGIEMGLNDWLVSSPTKMAVLGTFEFISHTPMTQDISVVTHPYHETPVLVFPSLHQVPCVGLTGFIEITEADLVANDQITWGAMKALYK
jgi:hypothetical protein